MLKHLFIIILSFYLLFIIYFRIRYKFWSKQPVFHLHNIRYWLFPPGIIQHEQPKLGKFFDRLIKTKKYSQLTKKDKYDIHQLIFSYYLDEKDVYYKPSKNSIFKYLQNHNSEAFISLFFKKKPFYDVTNKKSLITNKLISVITSRPLNCTIDGKELTTYYVDYLCVDQKFRKLGFAQKSIHSYYVNHCESLNSTELICLFKREDAKNIIVPLSSYKTYDYIIKDWNLDVELPNKYGITSYNQDTESLFKDYLESLKPKFKCYISTSLENINLLVKRGHIFIYGIMEGDKLLGVYAFRDSYTFYEGQKSLEFIASYKDDNLDAEDFIKGFSLSLLDIKKTKDFNRLLVEEVSHNLIIAYNLVQTYDPFEISDSSYYIYNYARYPIACDRIFCLF